MAIESAHTPRREASPAGRARPATTSDAARLPRPASAGRLPTAAATAPVVAPAPAPAPAAVAGAQRKRSERGPSALGRPGSGGAGPPSRGSASGEGVEAATPSPTGSANGGAAGVSVSPVASGSPTSVSSGNSWRTRGGGDGAGSTRRDEGVQYLALEELPPFAVPPEDRFLNDVLRRLGVADDWAVQFAALDDSRRLACHAPKLLVAGGGLRKMVGLVTGLVDSLRSALAKNALRCMGELFVTFGRRLDVEIDICVPALLRRAADTNSFIAEEAECTLREVCKAATEAKLLPPLLAAAANRQPRVRQQAVWCLAMTAQRLRERGAQGRDQLRSVAEAAGKALGDANADVRQSARLAAIVLAGAGGLLGECAGGAKLAGALLPGVDPATFDAFDPDSAQRCAELARGAGLSTSSQPVQRGLRSPGGALK